MPGSLAPIVLLLAAVLFRPAMAEANRMRVGDLLLLQASATWSIETAPDGFAATCLKGPCEGRAVYGRVEPGQDCSDRTLIGPDRERRGASFGEFVGPGIVWRLARWSRGCRNAHPPSLALCAVIGERRYRIEAAMPSCRVGPGFGSEAAILDFIRAMRSAVP